jgi:hypothetical protein
VGGLHDSSICTQVGTQIYDRNTLQSILLTLQDDIHSLISFINIAEQNPKVDQLSNSKY